MKSTRRKKINENGITLVALVVTIIVLLILAGVAIVLALGDNGLLGKAENANLTQKKATIEQEIELARAYSETYRQTSTTENYLYRVAEYLNDDNALKSISSDSNAEIIEDYVLLRVGYNFNYKITEDGTYFLGNKEEAEDALRQQVVDLKSSNIEFSYSTTNQTKGPVGVTITLKDDALEQQQKYSSLIVLRYKIGLNGNWQDYNGTFNVTENCVIYPALYNGKDYSQTSVTGEVSNIDNTDPTSASFEVGEVTENSIEVIAKATDEIGIKYFDFSVDGGTTYLSENRKTITTVTQNETTTSFIITGLNINTNYNIRVKATDEAGNSLESNSQTVKTNYLMADKVQFTPNNSNWKATNGTNITNVKQALDYIYEKYEIRRRIK